MTFFLDDHREDSSLAGELPEESEQFSFLRTVCLDNLQGSVGLVLVKISTMRISILLDLSTVEGPSYLSLASFTLVIPPLFLPLP